MREKLIDVCFKEFCKVAGDSPCGCDACPYGNYGSENGECYEEYKKNKAEALEGATVQKWIPVTERLPEHDVQVLVFNGDYIFISRYHEFRFASWMKSDLVWAKNPYAKDPTHWMPLPEPPKEVSQ